MTYSIQNLSKKHANIEVQLNRLLAQKASLQNKLKIKIQQNAKATQERLFAWWCFVIDASFGYL